MLGVKVHEITLRCDKGALSVTLSHVDYVFLPDTSCELLIVWSLLKQVAM